MERTDCHAGLCRPRNDREDNPSVTRSACQLPLHRGAKAPAGAGTPSVSFADSSPKGGAKGRMVRR